MSQPPPVPMMDIAAHHKALMPELQAELAAVLEKGQFVLGPQVEAFEEEVAAYLGTPHAVSCGSGTDALHLALLASGVGPGDEVITTPFSFATVEAILYVGARPVFVDIDPNTYNLDSREVEGAITPATRALLPVHIFGQPADMTALRQLAKEHELLIVEDCAQAFGASIGERMVGTFGDVGCFSFFPNKNLGACGDGGLLTTHSAAVAERLRLLRNHGGIERHYHLEVGYNSRLDEIQAAVLRCKLKRIDDYNGARQAAAITYTEALSDLEDIIVTPTVVPGTRHVFHQYTVQLPCRDGIQEHLQSQGVACAVHYPRPLYRQPALERNYSDLVLPSTEAVSRRCLSLPMFPEISQEQLERVVSVLRNSPILG